MEPGRHTVLIKTGSPPSAGFAGQLSNSFYLIKRLDKFPPIEDIDSERQVFK
jgi:hypothetical protein